jgi:hypothetical protein
MRTPLKLCRPAEVSATSKLYRRNSWRVPGTSGISSLW